MGRRLLLIDDDVELATLMRAFFSEHGYAIDVCHDGLTGIRRASESPFDLVLLDVMLPRCGGFTVLQELRRRDNVPVLMLTGVADPSSRVAGLEGGADDYLPKPFDPLELLARVNAVLRRARPAPSSGAREIEMHGIRLMPGTRTVRRNGATVDVTTAEYEILALLMRHAGEVVTRDQIARFLYQRDATPFDRWIDVHISRLRKKLECGRALIRTVRGTGYQFCPEAEESR